MFLNVVWLLTAMVVGFMLGRISMYGQAGEVVLETAEEKEPVKEFLRQGKTHGSHGAEEKRKEWSVGSPVSGEVMVNRDGERPMVIIRPDGDRLYAPVGGKITRLFPMGNAFLFATEFGTELYIQAGDVDDELLVRYYRPRIIQNEVVGKGKLLLEFDRQGLEAEGASTEVAVCVENCAYGGDVRMTAGERVKAGEEILQVREPL